MKRVRSLSVRFLSVLLVSLFVAATAFAAGGSNWKFAGNDLSNNRNAKTESKIKPSNVDSLVTQWSFTTGGDISATPAVEDDAVYFPDWAGNLFKVDRMTGEEIWSRQISTYTGIPGVFSRVTPAVYGDLLIFGDQGGRQFAGARVMAVNKYSGDLVWITTADSHPAAIITQSAVVFDDRIYVGVSSFEEFWSAVIPGYPCCSFRGSMMALDVNTGDILWREYTTPEGYSGNAVWGSAPAIDTKRNAVYISTGNNYSVPPEVQACVADNLGDPEAQRACLDPTNFFDAVLAYDLMTGALKWSTIVIPFDSWNVSCLPPFDELNPENCPDPAGPDFDFGQAPILYSAKGDQGVKVDLLGVGQKSGQFWALDPDTGAVVWSRQVGPGGVAGGMMWGSAYDGKRIYTANANSEFQEWTLVDGSTTYNGFWSALDPLTGEILWQTNNPMGNIASGAVTVANGVVFACSMDFDGHMYALDAATGEILWDFVSGGSCNAGAAVVNGMVYWGSGYASFGGSPNNIFHAFGLPK